MRHRATALSIILTSCVIGGCSEATGEESLGAQALDSLSPLEAEALQDKQITMAELERSAAVYEECLVSAGFSVEVADQAILGPSRFATEVQVGDDPAEADRYDAAGQACYDDVEAIEAVWLLQNQASDEELAAVEAAFVECARTAGAPVAEGASFEDAVTAAQDFVQEAQASSGDPGDLPPDAVAVRDCLAPLSAQLVTPLPGLDDALEALTFDED